MKFLDRLALKIFSIIIFIIAIIIILFLTGIITLNDIIGGFIVFADNNYSMQIVLGISAVLLLLAVKGLFFTSKPESKGKEGIANVSHIQYLVLFKTLTPFHFPH